ncbi:MAG: hypothetical protein LBE92_17265 [Chryseobacterium sp.]|jgi:hypothetical protein|uniref:hypothetical protein n=1 Tax=Chryseobacterium sp. TaxID=1871047 RepID=UPI002823FA8C|nr:hypothetical protein [Chryseobacterium sp.]MDR2237876.1 hypothetical protein [Chryseobacterium sp.]
MKNTFLLLCIIATSVLYSQNKDITGIYGQGLIGKFDPVADYIELKSDSTFTYNYDGKKYQGNWKLSENKVLLNPELKKEYARIQMKESRINSDSMTIKINYHLKKDAAGDQEFRMATIYFDKKGNYMNVLKNPYIRECSWAPVIRNRRSSITITP